nr:hydroxyacid dehydrogenase [Actinospica robiniae]
MTSVARLERPRVVLAMRPDLEPQLFDPALRARLSETADVAPVIVSDAAAPVAATLLNEAEVLLTGWGAPCIDEAVLAAAPRLRAVVHAAGSVRGIVTPACWERGIAVSTAAAANARPVAEYTLAMILLIGKQALEIRERYRTERRSYFWQLEYPDAGNYGRTVGIVGASRTGRELIRLLAPHDIRVLVYDPYLTAEDAGDLGVARVDLDELCAGSDIVTVHAPELPSTRDLINRDQLALMRDGTTLINTARGSLVNTAALLDELGTGRINAVLDVTEPDVLPADSPLFTLPNVVLTPHIAGSIGTELRRLGASAVAEIGRYARGEAFAFPLLHAEIDRTA